VAGGGGQIKAARRKKEEAKRKRVAAARAEVERVRGRQSKAQQADKARRTGKPTQQGYEEWLEYSTKAQDSPDEVPFPNPPLYGCYDVAYRV
jgi:hypothetical protein